jgi:hypothetical protein
MSYEYNFEILVVIRLILLNVLCDRKIFQSQEAFLDVVRNCKKGDSIVDRTMRSVYRDVCIHTHSRRIKKKNNKHVWRLKKIIIFDRQISRTNIQFFWRRMTTRASK